MAHRIVDEVAQRLADGDGIAPHRGGAAGQILVFKRDGHRPQPPLAQQFGQRVAHQPAQVERFQLRLVGAVDHHGIGQQLVGQVHGALGLLFGLAQPSAHPLGLVRIVGQRQLPLQRRQRGAGLMRHVGDEAFGQRPAAAKLRDEAVDRAEQGGDLLRGVAFDGREIARIACQQGMGDVPQRRQRGTDREPDKDQPDQRHAPQPGHAIKKQRIKLCAARALRLADLHEHPVPPRTGGDLPPLIDEAERLIEPDIIEHRIDRGARIRRQRQIRRAGQVAIAGGKHPVDHPVIRREREDIHGRLRQIHGRPGGGVGDAFQHRQRRPGQQQVIGAVGRRARIVPQQHRDQQQQQHEGRRHAGQQPPLQRMAAPCPSRRR